MGYCEKKAYNEHMQFQCYASTKEITLSIGQTIGQFAPVPCVLTLTGNLGAGKTTLTKGIARGMGIQTTVNSPTFNICKIYHGDKKLVHIDAYRLDPSIDELGFEEEMDDAITVIEWSENTDMILNDPISITIDYDGKNQRILTFEFNDSTFFRYDRLIQELQQWSH